MLNALNVLNVLNLLNALKVLNVLNVLNMTVGRTVRRSVIHSSNFYGKHLPSFVFLRGYSIFDNGN